MTRPLRLLAVHPGASWSTADVFDGLRYGLEQNGIDVVSYRLDVRIGASKNALGALYRMRKKADPKTEKPNTADIMYQAGLGALETALRKQVDVVVIVSAMLLHPDVIIMMKRAGLRVVVLFTESPYDHEKEARVAALVDGGWTTERSMVDTFRAICPNMGYLPHAWHPLKHTPDTPTDPDVPSYDVVFVGTAFEERVQFFNAIDWSGINLGLYGSWKQMGLKKQVLAALRDDCVENAYASQLYRRAAIGLNLYRSSQGWGKGAPKITHAESLSPRAYELAACGAFHLSEYRSEVPEVFGELVPTFRTPIEAAALIRLWLALPEERARVSAALPARVAEANWIHRARTVIGDLERLLVSQAA